MTLPALIRIVLLAAPAALSSPPASASELPRSEFVPPEATVAPAEPSGALSFGVRTGYSFPTGTLIGTGPSNALSNLYVGLIPLRFDIGYKFDRRLLVGGYFQYGFGFANTSTAPLQTVCGNSYIECSTSDIQTGVTAAFYFAPRAAFDPWIGVSAGYEIANLRGLLGRSSGGLTFEGLDFATVDLGIDIRVKEALHIAPYVSVAIGQFESCNATGVVSGLATALCPSGPKGIHEWTTAGLRWMFDVGL